MRFPYLFRREPLQSNNATLAAYQRTNAPANVWVGGRGGYFVQRSMAPLLGGAFATIPVPVTNDVNAGGFGYNATPGTAGLIKRNQGGV